MRVDGSAIKRRILCNALYLQSIMSSIESIFHKNMLSCAVHMSRHASTMCVRGQFFTSNKAIKATHQLK